MDHGKPDTETLRAAVAMACMAPSVHNTQPWRFEVGKRALHVYADRDRWLPSTDPSGTDLSVSCGAAVHHLRVALTALGWRPHVHLLPDRDDRDHLAALGFAKGVPGDSDIALAASVPRRRSDRRRFSSWPVPAGIVESLVASGKAEEAEVLVLCDPWRRHSLFTAASWAEAAQSSDMGYLQELAAWTGRSQACADGVPAASIAVGDTRYGDVRTRRFPNGHLPQAVDEDGVEVEEAVLLVATRTDSEEARLRAGMATSAVLLEATSAGLATCPLSQPLEHPSTRQLARDVLLGGALWPHLVVRVGWAAIGAPPPTPTPRRPLDEVFTPRRA